MVFFRGYLIGLLGIEIFLLANWVYVIALV